VETIISLWQSRQATECELAVLNLQAPIPRYQEPYNLFQPSNLVLHPHTESEMMAIATSASELPHVIQQLVVPKNNRTLRPLPKGDMDMVSNTQNHPDHILETNPSGIPNSLTGVVNFLSQFKDDKFKRPKAHPTQSLHSKFRNAEAKRAQPHWRTLKKAPLKEMVQTSVIALLNKAKPVERSHRNVLICQPTCPPSPPRRYKRSSTGDSFIIVNDTSNSLEKVHVVYPPPAPVILPPPQSIPTLPVVGGTRCDSSALLTASHSPVRGHDPGLYTGAYLALIVVFLDFCVCRFRHMIGVTD
jgi:hypothetical protein